MFIVHYTLCIGVCIFIPAYSLGRIQIHKYYINKYIENVLMIIVIIY